jgi:hypothetical protein
MMKNPDKPKNTAKQGKINSLPGTWTFQNEAFAAQRDYGLLME